MKSLYTKYHYTQNRYTKSLLYSVVLRQDGYPVRTGIVGHWRFRVILESLSACRGLTWAWLTC